jgi:hypothetical protein
LQSNRFYISLDLSYGVDESVVRNLEELGIGRSNLQKSYANLEKFFRQGYGKDD